MLSTCPSCLSQVNHEDHLFDVACECGAHFSPYLNVDDPKNNSFSGYAESKNAFSEIVEFGEKIGTALETPIEPPANMQMSPPMGRDGKLVGEVTPPPMLTSFSKGILITTGAELSGYVIQNHFPPISVVTPFQMTSINPIQQGVNLLWKMAETTGANGLIGLQTIVTPDAHSLLLIGIPVHCSKIV